MLDTLIDCQPDTLDIDNRHVRQSAGYRLDPFR